MEWNGILFFLNENLISILLCLCLCLCLCSGSKVLGVWPFLELFGNYE